MDDVDIKARRAKQAAYKAELDAQINSKNAGYVPSKEKVTISQQYQPKSIMRESEPQQNSNNQVYIAPIAVSKPNVFQENLTSQIKTIFSTTNARTFIPPLSSPAQHYTFQEQQLNGDFSIQFQQTPPKFVPQDPKAEKIRPIHTELIRTMKMEINDINIPQPIIHFENIEDKSHTYTPRCGFSLKANNFEFQSNKTTPKEGTPRSNSEYEEDGPIQFPNDLPYF